MGCTRLRRGALLPLGDFLRVRWENGSEKVRSNRVIRNWEDIKGARLSNNLVGAEN